MSIARASAVATGIVLAVLCCCPLALGADPPPATTPTSTTPDAPPPDPYKPPAPAAKPKPKASQVSRPAPVHSAPVVVHRPTYSPPVAASAPVAPVHRVQTRRVAPRPRPHPKPHHRKVVHKRRHHVATKPVAPKPVKVNFKPFANLVASSGLLATGGDDGDRSHYLWLAGLAFALLAAGGLSLHVLSVRVLQ